MNKIKMTSVSVFALLCAGESAAWAQARTSRSMGGLGRPIPKTEQQNQVPQQQNAPVQIPSQAQPMQGAPVQIPSQAQPMQGAPVQIPSQVQPQQGTPVTEQPVVVPPPVPVQVPTQMSFEPPIQVPSQGAAPSSQPQLPSDNSIQQPLQVTPQTAPQLPQGVPSQPPVTPAGRMSERYVQPSYGMAGCGLGSMIFKNNVRSEQWLASIVNDLIIPQSIVITTGTSNCVDVDEEQMQAEQEIFIDTNLHSLRMESARGDGENLRAFADLLGCQKEGLFDTFASSSQGQHSFIFSDAQPSAIAERYREVLKRSRALKARCERLF
ncbi:MAG: hypothetical protein RLZZ488_1124 [Pseudomonadota bacterium]|jgi:hypothetical protein